MAGSFGSEFTLEHVLGPVQNLASADSYLQRIAVLNALAAIGRAVGQVELQGHVLPEMVKYGEDPVPNVKFVLA